MISSGTFLMLVGLAISLLAIACFRRAPVAMRLAAIILGSAVLGLILALSPTRFILRGKSWEFMQLELPLIVSMIASFGVIHSMRKQEQPNTLLAPTSFVYAFIVTIGTLLLLAILLPSYLHVSSPLLSEKYDFPEARDA